MLKRIALILAAAACLPVNAENWPLFRGPRGDGTSLATNIPTRWSQTENVVWKTAIPGEGHSSPTFWEDSIFLTSAFPSSGERVLMRVNAETGEIEWRRNLFTAPRESMHRENNSASSTPVTDGSLVFTSFQNGNRVDLRAYDFSGREVWAIQPLQFEGEHGYSYTPVIHGDLLLFDCRQEGEAAILGLDKRTGREVWRATPQRKRISHIPPLVIHDGAKHQMVVSGSDETASYNPLTGEQHWRVDGPSDVSVAGLVYGEGMVFVTSGYPARGRMAIQVDGRGDVTETHVKWHLRRQASYVPSPVYKDGHVYTVMDEGMMFCINLESGEPVWDQRLGGRYRASLILVEDKIHATNDRGVTTIFEATPEGYREVAKNELDEFVYTTPAVTHGRLFMRTGENLYCFGANP